MRKKKIAILCVCCVVLAGLVYWTNANNGANLPAETAKREISVAVGETFAITLEENATTGYTWDWEADSDQIILLNEKNINPEDDNIVGASTMATWNFQAKEPGTYTITFTYARSWETEEEPARTETFTITVE